MEQVPLRILEPDPGGILAQDRELGPMDRVFEESGHRADKERVLEGLQLVAAIVGAGFWPRYNPVETDCLGGCRGIAELEIPAMEQGCLFPGREVAGYLQGLDPVGRVRRAESQPSQRVVPDHLEWPGQYSNRHQAGKEQACQPTANHCGARLAIGRTGMAGERGRQLGHRRRYRSLKRRSNNRNLTRRPYRTQHH